MEANKIYPDPSQVREELIQRYPSKVAKKRAKSIIVNDPEIIPEVQANVRTVPGIITQRGCCYAGCKGVVLGPTRDIVNIVHGPIGCSFYAWLTRRNQTRTESLMEANYIPYCFSTDMQEENVVFGGEKKLKVAIQEAYDLFHPKSIAIFSTCPVGLIGDDVHAASKEMREKFGDCNVFGFSCEGYRGVSQSAGHHIANNGVFKHMVGRDNTPSEGKFKLNLLGEYNIGGDAFEIERIFEKAGLTLISSFSGNSTIKQLENSHMADLNVIQCHRSINYMGDMMETKYGIPWMKVSFVGAESSAKSLRKIAEYFDDDELRAQVEAVIAEEMPKVKAVIDEILPRTTGKTAMLFVGGSRAHHYQDLFTELGMTTVAAGYEFAHRDDYEGRDVLPTIKIDADSKNIEELKVLPDPELYNPRKTDAELEALKEKGLEINGYSGMMQQMTKKSLVVDDLSHYESEKLIEIYKPDIFCAGIKEKYVVQKMGVPLKQLHSYDYGGPYTGFEGAVNFYKDIDRMVNNPVWKLIKAPWQKTGATNGKSKGLEASYVTQ